MYFFMKVKAKILNLRLKMNKNKINEMKAFIKSNPGMNQTSNNPESKQLLTEMQDKEIRFNFLTKSPLKYISSFFPHTPASEARKAFGESIKKANKKLNEILELEKKIKKSYPKK